MLPGERARGAPGRQVGQSGTKVTTRRHGGRSMIRQVWHTHCSSAAAEQTSDECRSPIPRRSRREPSRPASRRLVGGAEIGTSGKRDQLGAAGRLRMLWAADARRPKPPQPGDALRALQPAQYRLKAVSSQKPSRQRSAELSSAGTSFDRRVSLTSRKVLSVACAKSS